MLPTLASSQLDAEKVRCLGFQVRPGCHAAIDAFDELAGCNRLASSVEFIFAQEHLMRRVRRVGLVLVDERSGRVDRTIGVVSTFVDTNGSGIVAQNAVGARSRQRSARQHHEVGCAAGDIERIVGHAAG